MIPVEDRDDTDLPLYGKCMDFWETICGCMRTWAPCICCCCVNYPYQIVEQSYAGIYQKFGKYLKTVKPGLHYINPCTESLVKVGLRINVMDLSRQVFPLILLEYHNERQCFY